MFGYRTHERLQSNTRARLVDRRNADDNHPHVSPRTSSPRRPVNGRSRGSATAGTGWPGPAGPGPSRPAGAPRATTAPASRCPPRLIAGVPSRWRRPWGWPWPPGTITLWLGVVANSARCPTATPGVRPLTCPTGSPSCGWRRGVPAGRRSPGGARCAGSPGRRAHPRTQRPGLAGPGGGPDPDRAGRLTALENRSTPSCLAAAHPALLSREGAQVRSECCGTRLSARRRSGHALSVLPSSRFPGDRLAGNR